MIEGYLAKVKLDYLHAKMCDDSYPLPKWQPEQATIAVELYREFLWLNARYPGEQLVPTREIDEVWHNHILHTENYHRDCQAIFGHYLHHRPSNLNDADEDARLLVLFERTQELYQQEFNKELLVFVAEDYL